MKHAIKILIFEDRPVTAIQLQTELPDEEIQFRQVAAMAEFKDELQAFAPTLILARHSLPGCDGIAALAEARQKCSRAPFIFMCVAAEVKTALAALKNGATDYVLDDRIERLGFAARRVLREEQERRERQQARAALQEMEERYHALFHRAHDCLFVLDFDGNFLDANPAALALLGYTREEIPTVSIQTIVGADQLPMAWQAMAEVRQTGTIHTSREFNLKRKNGGHVIVETKASLVLRDGKPFAIQGIGRDTTARKWAELELQRVNRLYAVLSHVNQTLIHARTPEELLQQVCSITVEHGEFPAVRISRMDPESRRVMPVTSAGGFDEFIDMVPAYADDRPEGQGPTGTAIREGKISVVNDVQDDPRLLPWQKPNELAGFKAAASFPIRFCGNLYGALSLYVHEKNVFQEKEVALLSGVADAISSGLDRLEQETQRKRAEELLKERQKTLHKSDARYRRLVQETGQVVYDYDLSSGRIEWQGAMAEVFGYSWEEMQGIGAQEWEKMIHPDDRAQTLAQLDEAIACSRRYRVEYRFRRKDGTYIFVDEHGSFLRDESACSCRMLGTISDITERKNNEDQNREQARLLYLAHDAILARNLDDTIVYWNESAERLYGWTAEEVLGQSVDKVLQEEPSKAAQCKRTVLQHDECNAELTHSTKSGSQVLVESHMTLVRDRDGQRKSILSINRDITARKKLESQMLRSQRMESIGTLASGIAHDLNNVLTPILMSCQLLASEEINDERQQWIDLISRSAERGADLIKQVLSFCRGAEGRRMELQVKNLINEVSHIARQTFPKTIKFQTRVSKDLWKVVADPTQLHQVLLNLCVNARDAMPNGGVLTVAAENVMFDSPETNASRQVVPRPHLMITVADTGSGIPAEIREKIFDPFFTTKEVGKGTGLGLSTSLGIVKSHGGIINVYSEPNAGTVFKVYLPAVIATTAGTPQNNPEPLPRGNGELILIVDDEAAVRTLAALTLRTYGYNVVTASDGAEAIELYGRHANEVAVILMDMMMPVMDGRTTIHALSRRNQKMKIIAASGLFSEARGGDAPNDAVKAFLPKPYTAETLLKTIQMVIAGHERTEFSRRKNNAELNETTTLN